MVLEFYQSMVLQRPNDTATNTLARGHKGRAEPTAAKQHRTEVASRYDPNRGAVPFVLRTSFAMLATATPAPAPDLFLPLPETCCCRWRPSLGLIDIVCDGIGLDCIGFG